MLFFLELRSNDVKMARSYILTSLLLLVLVTDVQSQFFDFFGFQPIVQVNRESTRPKQEHIRRNDEHTTRKSISYPEETIRDENTKPKPKQPKRKQTTTIPLLSFNFYSTTVRPTRKTTKTTISSQRNNTRISYSNTRISISSSGVINSDSRDKSPDRSANSHSQLSGLGASMERGTNIWREPVVNNIANDYYTRPSWETTTKAYNVDFPRPWNHNAYTTKNPFYSRPGVKPAVVENRPPITNRPATYKPVTNRPVTNRPVTNRPVTNRPVTNRPATNKPVTHTPVIVYPRPTDPGAISFPQEDASPEIISGPDEDYMSEADKRRYIDLAERMCDKYKQLNTKQLQAIPLLPSPEPVQVNVSSCSPTKVPLVVGGVIARIEDFAHMALLGWIRLEVGGYSWKCGGSLISDRYVLTAGHCAYQERDNTVVTGPPRVVQLGSSYLDDPGALVVRVAAVVRHPKYKFPKSYYDIALLKLATTVRFSEVIKPACLGIPPSVGEPIIATGWGRTEFGGDQSVELRSVSLPVWDMSECWEVLGTSRKLPQGPSSDSQICAGVAKGGKDTCQGDSGGPAQIQDGCQWRVVAVTSLGRSCGAPHTPGLYATVHRAFIAAQVFGGQHYNNQQNNRQPNNNGQSTNSRQPNNNAQSTNNRQPNSQGTYTRPHPYDNTKINDNRKEIYDYEQTNTRPVSNVNNRPAKTNDRHDIYDNSRRTDTYDYNSQQPDQGNSNRRAEEYTRQGNNQQISPVNNNRRADTYDYNSDQSNGNSNHRAAYTRQSSQQPMQFNNNNHRTELLYNNPPQNYDNGQYNIERRSNIYGSNVSYETSRTVSSGVMWWTQS